ncbi:MAG TPA: DUF4097 family beta strand repeat-containing protein [Bryobacteraceae bacterium]|nr:DUF4097 family beta strand repeat-containing protein [Bryobacteraceae bacterium]
MTTLKVLLGLALAAAASAQMVNNQEKQLSCENQGSDDRARSCEIREQTTASVGLLNIDAGKNGGANIKGWTRSDVLVRTRVESWANSDAEAKTISSQVLVDTSGGRVQTRGPEAADNSGWSVSYEIFVPQSTSLNVTTFNGGISISDVRGNLHFEATNGGITLKRLAGEVEGATVNGGVNIELAGNTWQGNKIDVKTRNGGVNIAVPENFSAHFQTETVNGSLQSDFPLTMSGELRSRSHDFTIGGGGPLIHVTTTNGGVKLRRT